MVCLRNGTRFGLSMLPLALFACGGPIEGRGQTSDGAPAYGALGAALAAIAPGIDAERSDGEGSLVITPVAPPRPVSTTDGQTHLVYELLVQNTGTEPQLVERIDVLEAEHRCRLARYEAEALSQMLIIANADELGRLPAGGVAIAFVDLVLAEGHVPHQLRHEIVSWSAPAVSESSSGPNVEVVRERPIRVGAPLRGGGLVDLNGCCTGDHTRALLAFDDGVFIAQRFAIDFLRAQGVASFEGDPSENESYFLYGADVLAVSSGTIVATGDGMAENIPTEPLSDVDVATATGNYVVEELDDGHFALYAHLQPASLRVQPGDEVARGDVLGLVGNSGNSSEPHLHFQVMSGPAPLDSDGLPYVFDGFSLEGQVDVNGADGLTIVPMNPPRRENDTLPMNLDVIAFP